VALTLVPSVRATLAAAAAERTATGPTPFGALRLVGDVLALGAALASAAYARRFQQARAAGRAPTPLGVALLTFALGSTALAVRAALLGEPVVPLGRLDVRGVLLLATFGIVSTFVPTLAFAMAAQRLTPVLTSAAQLLVPVVSATAAAIALGELPSAWLVPGGALVAAGLVRLLTAAPPAAQSALPGVGD
jgi:drug/metabolite transporter (DMT)-like permease